MRPIKQRVQTVEVTIQRDRVLWTSPDGEVVVVEGPFPHGFQRSLTGKTLKIAVQDRARVDIAARPETTNAHPAKTLARLVQLTGNEFGEVCP